MLYSFMSFSVPHLTLEEMLETAKRFGYDGVEPRCEADHRHGIEISASASERTRIRDAARRVGIAYSCVATSRRYADPAQAEESVAQTHDYIDLAADIGCSRIRVFGGPMGEGLSREEAVELVARSLSSVADHAAERGVVVCMETHDDWCDPRDVARVMERVGHDAVGVNWDIMHPVRAAGYTMADAYPPIRRWVKHVHFHDGTKDEHGLHLVPVGKGCVDHRAAVKLLLDDGYEGFLSGEWIDWEIAWETHLPQELATMKGYEREQAGSGSGA